MPKKYTKEEVDNVIEGEDEDFVRAKACGLDYIKTPPRDAALIVSKLLLYPSNLYNGKIVKMHNKTGTPYEKWLDELKEKKMRHKSVMAGRWMMGSGLSNIKLSLYSIFLFNINYGKTRELFYKFLTHDDSPPPYLDLVLTNILHQGLGLTHTEIKKLFAGPFLNIAKYLNIIFNSESDIIENWLKNKPKDLRFYGGATNTVVGLYDRFFSKEATGTGYLNKKASMRYDLGGGFNTSEIERLIGASFISADIISPNMKEHDSKIVIQKITSDGAMTIADTETQALHVNNQSNIEYLKFDVLKNSFPIDHDSYLIVSTGFTTSTVRPNNMDRTEKKGGYGHVLLSIHAILRVVELAHRGKDVDFFTIQRATNRAYKYKTCLIQWRGGEITRLITTDDKEKKRWAKDTISSIYRYIDPNNEEFKSYMNDSVQNKSEIIDQKNNE